MYEVTVLREFLLLLTSPRYKAKQAVPDGSGVWLCLAYGLERLVDDLGSSDEVRLSETLLAALTDLAARVGQFARASANWTAEAEWQSVEDFARQVQTLLDREARPRSVGA